MRRQAEGETVPLETAPEADASPLLEPVAVFQEGGVVEGSLEPREGRLSDALNSGHPLSVLIRQAGEDRDVRVVFHHDDVVAVAAPPQPQPSPRRLSRRRHVLELRAGPYLFTGTAHLPAGADPLRYARAAPQRWLTLTDCTAAREGDEWAVDVLIVNLDHLSRNSSRGA